MDALVEHLYGPTRFARPLLDAVPSDSVPTAVPPSPNRNQPTGTTHTEAFLAERAEVRTTAQVLSEFASS